MDNLKPDSVKTKADKPESYFKDLILGLDSKVIIKGLIVVLAIVVPIKLLFTDTRYLYLCIAAIFIGSLIAGYFSRKAFKNGAINGATVGLIFYFLNALFVIWFLFFPD